MELIYIANARIPTEKAHGIQIMKMCEAFADAGVAVELVLPWRFNFVKSDPFEYYGARKNFKITKLPSLDLVKFGKFGFLIQSLSFACAAFWYVLLKKADVIYSRDELPLFFLSFFKKNIVWETHSAKKNFLVKRALDKCRAVIAITRGLKDFYVEKYGAASDKILVAPDGVDMEKFDIGITKEEAREKLNLPLDKKIILYTGHFYKWKGVDALIQSGKFLDENTLIYLVGGTEEGIARYELLVADCENIIIAGHKPHGEIPYWLKAADVLVLPNSGKEAISKIYTSPMKLFEYMASGIPIAASDLPSIGEILNDPSTGSGRGNALLVEPDNPEALAEGIKKILQNPDFSGKISRDRKSVV